MVILLYMVIPSPVTTDKGNGSVQFTAIRQSPVSKQVSEQIKTLIIEGNLKPGDKLPSERELAKAIQVGRLSLREALRILETLGIIETKYGVNSGSYISRMGIENLKEKFSECLRLGNITVEKLYEARLELGLISVKYFFKRGTKEDLRKMSACVEEAESLLKMGLQTREKNIHFHQLLAQASQNPVFMLVQHSLIETIRHFLSKFDSPHKDSKKMLDGNKRILKQLERKDVQGALKAMEQHVLYSRQSLKSMTHEPRRKKQSH
jgi:GntR family transcriptional repressor for pyruvate dehydrogenase complex